MHDASGKPELRRKDEEKIKKQTGAQRGRGLVGKSAVCPESSLTGQLNGASVLPLLM